MIQATTPRKPEALPKRRLILTSLAALLVASALVVGVVLPAEYGVDPSGVGELLGLNLLAAAPAQAVEAPSGATANTPVLEGPVGHYAGAYQADSAEFTLGPYEYVEYKYRLEKDASMLYSWTAGAAIVHDFHGAPDGDANKEQSFDKKDRREGHGAFTAPFSGIHGWYWENPGGETITVRLNTAGFYSAATEFRIDRTRHQHQLTTLHPAAKERLTQ